LAASLSIPGAFVASQILFDLSRIDLNSVAVTSDEVARMNPQAGHMRQLDYVIWTSDDFGHSLGVKQVRHDEFWVDGHIPGRPLLPGVMMIEAGAQLASIAYRLRMRNNSFMAFTHIDKAVFRAQVVPGDTLYLLAVERKFQPRRFICDIQGVVRDSLAFEATISGMTVGEARQRAHGDAPASASTT
jgi:3-hydroxyacyl-[acyl-carrier-protein] dehydratase